MKESTLKKGIALLLATIMITSLAACKNNKDSNTELTTKASQSGDNNTFIYVVESGDTLSSIANKYETTVDAILKLNPKIINPNIIHVGDRIVIPKIIYKPIDRKTIGEQIDEQGYAYGIDISHVQSTMNVKKVLQMNPDISYVIIRMAYFWKTNDKIDINFEKQAIVCHEMGVPIGIYIWPTAKTKDQVEKEVRMTIDELEKIRKEYGIKLELPIFLDIENEGDGKTVEDLYERLSKKDPNAIRMLNLTIKMFEQAGYYVCIYCNVDTANIIASTKFDFKTGYWIAGYDFTTPQVLDRVGPPVVMHQTTDMGKVSGYNGNVDKNKMLIELKKVIAENNLNRTKR